MVAVLCPSLITSLAPSFFTTNTKICMYDNIEKRESSSSLSLSSAGHNGRS